MNKGMKILPVILVSIVTAVALSGCSGSGTKVSAPTVTPAVSQSANPAKQFAFGDVVKVRGQAPAGWANGVKPSPGQESNDGNITVSAPTFFMEDKAGSFSIPAKNGVFVVFSITAVGVSGQFYINPLDFYIRGSDGTHYGNAVAIFDPAFPDGTLTSGEPNKGNVSFDIPTETGTLVYNPLGMPVLGEWKF